MRLLSSLHQFYPEFYHHPAKGCNHIIMKYWRYWMKWDKVKKRLKSAKQVNFWPSIIHDCTNLIRLNISKGNGIMQCTDIGFVHVFVSFHKQTLMLNIIYMGIKELICKGHCYEIEKIVLWAYNHNYLGYEISWCRNICSCQKFHVSCKEKKT